VVLGSGVDIAYPDRHAPLFRQILESGGALVSTLADGTHPTRFSFLRRNPLIAALADVVIVVEADVRSGSLSTARAAIEHGRVLAAWPGSRGCDRLIARGAAVVECVEDVDLALAGTPRSLEPVVLDPETTLVRDAIAAGACGVDAIVEHTSLPVRHVLRALARLP
jgi:DNA processing protein